MFCSAVPGAGKTKTLVYKVAYLIEHCNIDPDRILVISFTKKSSNEIKDRIEKILLNIKDNNIISGTFHSVCFRFLKALGLIKNKTHIDDKKQSMILENIIKKFSNSEYNNRLITASKTEISKIKNKSLDFNKSSELFGKIYVEYEKYLNDHNYLDFDDLLLKLVQEIRTNEESKEYLENRFDYVFVDEFQDTNFLQFEIVACFAGKSNNITIVGDSDQSIYGWRFADSSNVKKFKEKFKDHTIYLLNKNYRSTQNIINCSNSVIEQEPNRINDKIVTDNNIGDKVILTEFIDYESEAKHICDQIGKIVKSTKNQQIAILLRTNQQSRIYEEILTKLKIPFQLLGNYDFYESEDIQYILSWLKFIVNNKDIISFKTIVDLNGNELIDIGEKLEIMGWDKFKKNKYDNNCDFTIKILKQCINMNNSNNEIDEIINHIIESINFQDTLKNEYGEKEASERWENIGELINASQQYSTIETFLMDMVLTENGNKSIGPKVSISTVHSSKGLEWDIVFIPSIVESLIPHSKSIDVKNINSVNDICEERRLLYVAMTRAKQQLYLSYCKAIKNFGRREIVSISRFLQYLPVDSIDCYSVR
jgi:DNA helicase-2/ATP-dependent DNA helicase PcrA